MTRSPLFAASALALLAPLAAAQVVTVDTDPSVPPGVPERAAVGDALDRDGDLLAVGAPAGTSTATPGAVYVYERVGGAWQLADTLSVSVGVRDRFGIAVAAGHTSLGGATIVVGAPWHPDGARAYVFEQGPGGWVQTEVLGAPDLVPGDAVDERFGSSVALDGDTLVVGDPTADLPGDENTGAAYVFLRRPAGWRLAASLFAPSPPPFGALGTEVDVSGDTVLAVKPSTNPNDDGRVEVWVRSGASWLPQATLVASDPVPWTAFDESADFARSAAISGDVIVVGDPRMSSSRGGVLVFERSGTSWSPTAVLMDGMVPATLQGTGYGVAVDGARVAAIGRFSDSLATWSRDASGGWAQRASLRTSELACCGESFDHAVEVEGDSVLAGTPFWPPDDVSDRGGWLELSPPAPDFGASLCHGDGSGTPCPCSDSPIVGGPGCPHPQSAGALLVGHGSDRWLSDELELTVVNARPNVTALLAYGTQDLGGGAPFRNGLLCMGGEITRLTTRTTDAHGVASWGPGPLGTGLTLPGLPYTFQVWYRDPMACGMGFNLSNAFQVTFRP